MHYDDSQVNSISHETVDNDLGSCDSQEPARAPCI